VYSYKKFRYNDAASCANCRKQFMMAMFLYAGANDGWYPAGGTNEWDSLAKCIPAYAIARVTTSHKLAPAAMRCWSSNQTLTAEVCCYHYNEGLRRDDPNDLILMYYKEPTLWECNQHRMKELGRPVLSDSTWEFLPEAEFQRRQSNTVAFLAVRDVPAKREEHLVKGLQLTASLLPSGTNDAGPRVRIELINHGPKSVGVFLAEKPVFVVVASSGDSESEISCPAGKFTQSIGMGSPARAKLAELDLQPCVTNWELTTGKKISTPLRGRAQCWLNSIRSTNRSDSVMLESTLIELKH